MRNGDTVPVGATGLTVQANKLKEISVKEVQPGTPAFGQLEPGTLIVGVNGTPLGARELHVNPHARMNSQLKLAMKECGPDSEAGRFIAAGWIRSGVASTIPEDTRKVKHSIAGMVNSIEIFQAVIASAPESAADLAEAIAKSGRLEIFDDANLVKILKDKDEEVQDRYVGLFPMLEQLPPRDRDRLAATLYNHFRPELFKRVKATKGAPEASMLDMLVDLTRIRSNIAGWQPIGTPRPSEVVWKYLSFDPESLGAKAVAPKGAQIDLFIEGLKKQEIGL